MPITQQQIDALLLRPETMKAKSLLDDIKLEVAAEGLPDEKKKQLAEWQVLLKFLAIPLLPFEDIKELFASHIMVGLKREDIDVVDLLTQFMVPYQGTNVDEYKRDLFEALEGSEETLGNVQIILPNNTAIPSTVGGWLQLHVAKVGRGRKRSAENLQYVAQEKSIAKLNPQDRGALRQLLQLYNLLQPLPLDDERLFQLDDSDFWWGVDVPYQYQGLFITDNDRVVNEATFTNMQREADIAQTRPTPTTPTKARQALPPRPGATPTRAAIAPPPKITFDVKVALADHPGVGEIVLTEAPFTDEQGAPKKPTVRAWLQDYVRYAGLDYHTFQEREAYFFESANAKALSEEEKAKLRMLLQSFDDGRPLTFSEDFSSIQFKPANERLQGLRMQPSIDQQLQTPASVSSISDVRRRTQ